METVKVELTQDQIQKAVNDAIADSLKSSYNNPVRKAVDFALASQQSAIDEVVKSVIASSLSDPQFREKLGEVVLNNLVANMMKKDR